MLCTCVALLGVVGGVAWQAFDLDTYLARLGAPTAPGGAGVARAGDEETIPDFSVIDLHGRTWTRAELDGRPVVINFWATWCPPCREELPELQRLSDTYAGDGLVVLLVDVQESEADVRAYLDEKGIDLPCIIDVDGGISRRFHVNNLPTNVLVRPDGTVGGRIVGWQGPNHLRRGIEFILD